MDVEKELAKSNPQGSVDALNTSQIFDSDNGLGIPTIAAEPEVPGVLMPYRTRLNDDVVLAEEPQPVALHFFMEDYRFEGVWSRAREKARYMKSVGFALSPDFSLYRDWPLALALYNVYRNRWCGAYWQSLGVRMIPTVSWSGEESHTFCFLGVEKGSAVAISSVGVNLKDSVEREAFAAGCREMMSTIEPGTVLLQAETFPEEFVGECGLGAVELKQHPPRWKSIRHARKLAEGRRTGSCAEGEE